MERRESWKIHLADQLLREGDLKKRETKDHFLVWGSSRVNIRFADMRTAAAAAKSLQSCPTLCNPIDGRSPGSAVPGILQARTMEWVAISFSNAWKWKVKVKSLSRVRLLATPWTAAYEAAPSMGFSRQEYWSGVPLPSPIWGLGGGKEGPLRVLFEMLTKRLSVSK